MTARKRHIPVSRCVLFASLSLVGVCYVTIIIFFSVSKYRCYLIQPDNPLFEINPLSARTEMNARSPRFVRFRHPCGGGGGIRNRDARPSIIEKSIVSLGNHAVSRQMRHAVAAACTAVTVA